MHPPSPPPPFFFLTYTKIQATPTTNHNLSCAVKLYHHNVVCFFKHFSQPKYSKLYRKYFSIEDNDIDCVSISPRFHDGVWRHNFCSYIATHPFICEKLPGMFIEPPSFFYMYTEELLSYLKLLIFYLTQEIIVFRNRSI